MSRMLEALKEIQAKSPQTRPAIKPISPEELDSFGLGRSAELPAREPAQAPPSTLPDKPGRQPPPRERTDEPPAKAIASEPTLEAPPGSLLEPSRPLARPLSPLDDAEKEPYRELAGRVLAQRSPGLAAAMMFTSPGDGEGKTSTLASLAVVLAETAEEEIAAVDANLRSPTLGNRLGIWADRGLVDVLTDGADWRELVRRTSVPRLSVLPAGQVPSNHGPPPTGLKLASVLDALRNRYRLVLIDAPSLAHPEVAPWSRLCDGTYLVVELGQTGRRAARQAVRLIERCGGRVLGCVLVNAPVEG